MPDQVEEATGRIFAGGSDIGEEEYGVNKVVIHCRKKS